MLFTEQIPSPVNSTLAESLNLRILEWYFQTTHDKRIMSYQLHKVQSFKIIALIEKLYFIYLTQRTTQPERLNLLFN